MSYPNHITNLPHKIILNTWAHIKISSEYIFAVYGPNIVYVYGDGFRFCYTDINVYVL